MLSCMPLIPDVCVCLYACARHVCLLVSYCRCPPGHQNDLLKADEAEEDDKFAIVFAAMGVNMETAHFFKQVGGWWVVWASNKLWCTLLSTSLYDGLLFLFCSAHGLPSRTRAVRW